MTTSDLDQRLLAALRVNSREPVASLARTLGVSRATVKARIDRLVATGTIVGFSVRVRESDDARTIRAVALVEVEGRTTDAVIRQLRGIAEVDALHTTNGAWDLVVELRAESLHDFDGVLRQIRSIEGVLNSETSLLLRSISM